MSSSPPPSKEGSDSYQQNNEDQERGSEGARLTSTGSTSSSSSSTSSTAQQRKKSVTIVENPVVKQWLDQKSNETKEKVEENKRREQRRRWFLGACYLLAMGVCGVILVALGSTLTSLAAQCGTTATAVGSVFVTRGCGAIFGAISSAKLYESFDGNRIITTTLICLAGVLVYMPFITQVWELHVSFGLLGICTAITDTGAQIMTRFIHGFNAGPWLGANTVSFGISGALVPAVAYLTGSLYIQYSVLAVVALIAATVLFFAGEVQFVRPVRMNAPGSSSSSRSSAAAAPWYSCGCHWMEFQTEMIVAWMIFWLIGGKVTATAFLQSYVDETGILSDDDSDLLIMILWIAITIGRVLGVVDQNFITTPILYNHLAIFLVGGVLSMALILALPYDQAALWVAVAAYGFFNGPTVGYCYDLVNRLTIPSEKGMSIVMFGLNFGASLVPFVMSEIWDAGGGPDTLTVTIFISMLIPLPLLCLTKIYRNDKTAYEALPTVETDDESNESYHNSGANEKEGHAVATTI